MGVSTRALRLYGKNDLRVESFILPEITDDEILARVICDSLCMSSYKAAIQGAEHKRVPDDVAVNPIILGHEFCGEIIEVGRRWQEKFHGGDRFAIQPALNYKNTVDAPGYSFPYIGGCATYIIIPPQVMELGCLLPYKSKTFFYGSMAEPLSCVIGSFKEFFHTELNVHEHIMGIKPGGSLAILAGAGPMGLAAVDYITHCERRPARLVVTDINSQRLEYAERMLPPEEAKQRGVELLYINTGGTTDPESELKAINGGKGYDDILVMAPVKMLVELGGKLLGTGGCCSFFAGPSDKEFSANINFYDIHYNSTRYLGTVGGNSADMCEAIEMSYAGQLNPAMLITHIGGLDCAAEATMNLPDLPGGKKLIYTNINIPLTAITDFGELGRADPRFKALAEITTENKGLWSGEAERYLLENFAG